MKFRLLSADFEKRHLPLHLVEQGSNSKSTSYCTIIIGKNGTGKSRLLASVCRVFALPQRSMPFARTKAPRADEAPFEVGYCVDDHKVAVAYGPTTILNVTVDGTSVEDFSSVPLPRRVIATTITPFDKFPINPQYRQGESQKESHRDAELDHVYRYLGAKSAFGQNFLSVRITRIIEALLASSESHARRIRLNEVFDLLKYRPFVQVKYEFRQDPDVLLNATTRQQFVEKLLSRFVSYRRDDRRDMLLTDSDLFDELQHAIAEIEKLRTERLEVVLPLDLSNFENLTHSREAFRAIALLRRYELLTFRDLQLFKSDSSLNFGLRDASSGELGVVLTILGIAGEIDDGSLIFIDEPEISLHPEWQDKFVDLLMSTFVSPCVPE